LTRRPAPSHINTMARRRKRLTERVAARKAGLSEEDGRAHLVASALWRKRLRRAGVGLQVITFALVVFEAFMMIESGFKRIELPLVVAYLFVFFAGRVMQVIAGFTRR